MEFFPLRRLIADFHQRSTIFYFAGAAKEKHHDIRCFVTTPADGMPRYLDRGNRDASWRWDFDLWGWVAVNVVGIAIHLILVFFQLENKCFDGPPEGTMPGRK